MTMADEAENTGERDGRALLTPEGCERLAERAEQIRSERLPALRPLLVESERDERDVAEFERLVAEADALDALLAEAVVIGIDPATFDGRIRLGMRVQVSLADGTTTWVRPVHPVEAAVDDERISVSSPLAVAIVGARIGHTVWVDAPTGAWPCEVLAVDLAGVQST